MVQVRSVTASVLTLLLKLALESSTANASESVTSHGTSLPPPAFLELDRSKLPSFFALAKDRHNEAVHAARQAYYCAGSIDANYVSETREIDNVQVETHVIEPPSTWSLPDFPDDFANEIKVTRGASVQEGDDSTPLFSPEECQQVIDAAEAHFEGESWTTLPSGQYDVAG
jgi:hypothetical protein